MQQIDHFQDGYHFSSDRTRMQWEQIHSWLAEHSYWAKNIPFETVRESGEHAYCIGIFKDGVQLGFARLISDYCTFAYLSDVFVTPEQRGKGLSKILMQCIMELDWIQGLRRFMLCTWDAQELYRQFGFVQVTHPERFMEISKPDIYKTL